MKRLRHPIHAIREPFGTAGLIVACVALVAALGGTALAAKGSLTGKQKKEVTKIAKRFAGKPGAAGAQGPAGPAGAKGDAGSAGANGDAGAAGTNGTNGTNGKSVSVAAIAEGGSKCEGRAGAEVKQEGASSGTAVCDGSPWTAGGTLPPEQTETGSWSASGSSGDIGTVSFALPLTEELPISDVHFIEEGAAAPSACENGAEPASASNPEADPGHLCIWVGFGPGLGTPVIFPTGAPPAGEGAGRTGAAMLFSLAVQAWGTFAVTAPAS